MDQQTKPRINWAGQAVEMLALRLIEWADVGAAREEALQARMADPAAAILSGLLGLYRLSRQPSATFALNAGLWFRRGRLLHHCA